MYPLDDRLPVVLGRTRSKIFCHCCGRRVKQFDGAYVLVVRDLDVGGVPCYIQYSQFKLNCRCSYRGFERPSFVREYSRCTVRLEEYVSRLRVHICVKEVSDIMRLDWKTVKNADKHVLKEKLRPLWEVDLFRIHVDEIAYEKGHKYLTVVRDVDRGNGIWVGRDRKELTMDLFFALKGYERSMNIKAIVMDMRDPYITSVKKNTRAEIVFDKFHLTKKANEYLDMLRRKEFAKADKMEMKKWRDKRFLVLGRRKNLPTERIETLDALLETNQALYKAYLLKEQLLGILDETNHETAIQRLTTWKDNVQCSDIQEFGKLLKTI